MTIWILYSPKLDQLGPTLYRSKAAAENALATISGNRGDWEIVEFIKLPTVPCPTRYFNSLEWSEYRVPDRLPAKGYW